MVSEMQADWLQPVQILDNASLRKCISMHLYLFVKTCLNFQANSILHFITFKHSYPYRYCKIEYSTVTPQYPQHSTRQLFLFVKMFV